MIQEPKKGVSYSFVLSKNLMLPSHKSVLMALGCRTLHDVACRDDLTQVQKVGLKYFDDFEVKIPREEVELLFTTVRKAAAAVTADLMQITLEMAENEVCSSFVLV